VGWHGVAMAELGLELVASMAASMRCRGKGRREGGGGGWRGRAAAPPHRQHGAGHGRKVGMHGSNGGGTAGAWRTRRHFIEHVACGETSKVGCRLGLDLGRFSE
jgi:hypothetical protein